MLGYGTLLVWSPKETQKKECFPLLKLPSILVPHPAFVSILPSLFPSLGDRISFSYFSVHCIDAEGLVSQWCIWITMKHPFHQCNQDRHTGVDSETNSMSSYCVSDGNSDISIETNLTEPDPSEWPAKHLKMDMICTVPKLPLNKNADNFSNNPLDDAGENLCDILKDYDKSDDYILQQDHMKDVGRDQFPLLLWLDTLRLPATHLTMEQILQSESMKASTWVQVTWPWESTLWSVRQ